MKLFITSFKPCKHLKGKKPSDVTPAMLRKAHGGGSLELCAADAWDAMQAAAKLDGIDLAPTSVGDMFRSIAQQKAGFMQTNQMWQN